MSDKKKRDDFTWLLLLFETRKRKTVPLKTGPSYYRRGDNFSQGYRFSDERKADEEQEEMMKRARKARQQGLVYLIVTIASAIVFALLLH